MVGEGLCQLICYGGSDFKHGALGATGLQGAIGETGSLVNHGSKNIGSLKVRQLKQKIVPIPKIKN